MRVLRLGGLVLDGLEEGAGSWVGVGPIGSGTVEAELDAALVGRPAGVALRGTAGLADVEHLGAKLCVREALLGWPDGATRVVALVDTAAGVLALPTLAGGTRRLAAIGLDMDALAAALGCAPDAPAVALAGAQTILAAAAAGVPAARVRADDPGPDEAESAKRAGWSLILVGPAGLFREGDSTPDESDRRRG